MHARLVSARTRPGSADRAREIWTQLLEGYRAAGGFVGLVVLYGGTDGDLGVTLALWESGEAADRAAEELRPKAVAAFQDLLLEPARIEPYDVLLNAL